MNLFRSEEHVRNWFGFEAGTEEGMIPLNDLVKLFSGNSFLIKQMVSVLLVFSPNR